MATLYVHSMVGYLSTGKNAFFLPRCFSKVLIILIKFNFLILSKDGSFLYSKPKTFPKYKILKYISFYFLFIPILYKETEVCLLSIYLWELMNIVYFRWLGSITKIYVKYIETYASLGLRSLIFIGIITRNKYAKSWFRLIIFCDAPFYFFLGKTNSNRALWLIQVSLIRGFYLA